MASSICFSFNRVNVSFQSFNYRERHAIDFICLKSKIRNGRVLSCDRSHLYEFEERTSPNEVKEEIKRCYELIHRLGRGVAYLGSSRIDSDHPYHLQTLELGREVANLLDSTSWTGAGPGLMDAATKGALQAGKPVGGFKIAQEAGQWSATNFHPYLPSETYLTCRAIHKVVFFVENCVKLEDQNSIKIQVPQRFFSARKHGLVDAVVRRNTTDKTAVIALPGGIGTLDEVFEILALIQLERIGSELPVPFLLMNYDSFYSKLLDFLDDCEKWGTITRGEVAPLWKVCSNNVEALAYLAEFYGLPFSLLNDKQETKLMS